MNLKLISVAVLAVVFFGISISHKAVALPCLLNAGDGTCECPPTLNGQCQCPGGNVLYCVPSCYMSCSNTCAPGAWENTGTPGHQVYRNAELQGNASCSCYGAAFSCTSVCSCTTGTLSSSYRCAAGYYGTSVNGTSGCTRCPASGMYEDTGGNFQVYGTVAVGNGKTQADCYVSAGVYYDDTGDITISASCSY